MGEGGVERDKGIRGGEGWISKGRKIKREGAGLKPLPSPGTVSVGDDRSRKSAASGQHPSLSGAPRGALPPRPTERGLQGGSAARRHRSQRDPLARSRPPSPHPSPGSPGLADGQGACAALTPPETPAYRWRRSSRPNPGFWRSNANAGERRRRSSPEPHERHGKLQPRSTRALTQSVRRCHAQERAWTNAVAHFGREIMDDRGVFHDWAKTRADAVASVTGATVR